MSDNAQLIAAATAWVDADPHLPTQSLGREILASEDMDKIREHFGTRLEFGTAGLRGQMGPGPNRMNHATVRRAAFAFGKHLQDSSIDVTDRGVVIGFDARHGSKDFALETACVLGALGIPTFLYDECQPTPVIAHAIQHLNAAGGVIVTASHNPPQDNGYKVYWANGAQIVPPHDRQISELIDEVTDIRNIIMLDEKELRHDGLIQPLDPRVRAAYFEAILNERVNVATSTISLVYTAMHGVGFNTMREALNRAGYEAIYPVESQVEPDPEFPTVEFPNPEEPGAMDLALATAKEQSADLILANDPDADRLCVGIRQKDGQYRVLSGNEVGILVGDELLRNKCRGQTDLVATTIVSTQLLGKLARSYGSDFSETLTGFKWLANAALEKESNGGRFLFGFEEALGYSIGSVVRDKDGISVALIICDLASSLKVEGLTLLDRLREIYLEHGVHLSAQHSIKLPGASGREKIESMMTGLRAHSPESIAGYKVVNVIDYQTRMSICEGRSSELVGAMPPSNVLAFYLEDGTRLLARPSGTEPKIKFYFEVSVPLNANQSLAEGEAAAREHLGAIEEHFIEFINASFDG